MCGIVGLLRWDEKPVERSVVQAMTDAVAHRGPDGEGRLMRENVGLGHRRLAIIDPEGGHQPLSNENGRVWITYNGELYNFQGLRRTLEARGHAFRTKTDTETVVHAYEQWGEACVERFRGMFAFGIVDFRRRRLFLARDHLGIKPLYYAHQPGFFAFASELQAFHHVPDLELTLDLRAIDEYLWLRYIPAPHTGFRQVRKLPPAHRVSVGFDGGCEGPEAYWRLSFCREDDCSEEEWAEALDQRLRASVEAHLVSDVPFGAFLSGGVDSSAIVAYMAQILEQPVRTFTIGFAEEGFDERSYARMVADQFETQHFVEVVQPDAVAILPKLVRHYGEPFGDSSAVPTYYLCEMARQFVPMVLSGDGGDEAFLGYDSYERWVKWLDFDDVRRMAFWKRMLYPFVTRLLPWRYLHQGERVADPRRWLAFRQQIRAARRRSLWRAEYGEVCQTRLSVFDSQSRVAQDYSPVGLAQYMDLRIYLPSDILTKVDVASMMHGLEVRTPIVDVRVIELAAQIPVSHNFSRDSEGEWQGKLSLKKALRRYYSAPFLERPKMGFSVPLSRWFGVNGSLREMVHERLLKRGAPLHELFEPQAVRELVADTSSGQKLWMLLFLSEWLDQNAVRL